MENLRFLFFLLAFRVFTYENGIASRPEFIAQWRFGNDPRSKNRHNH